MPRTASGPGRSPETSPPITGTTAATTAEMGDTTAIRPLASPTVAQDHAEAAAAPRRPRRATRSAGRTRSAPTTRGAGRVTADQSELVVARSAVDAQRRGTAGGHARREVPDAVAGRGDEGEEDGHRGEIMAGRGRRGTRPATRRGRVGSGRLPIGNLRPWSRSSRRSWPGRTGAELAALPVPEHYRAAFVRREDVGMFEGLASADKDPTKSLHVDDVPTPELAPDEAYVAVMASSINFNTVWTRIFEPRADVRLPRSPRPARASGGRATPSPTRWSARTRPASCSRVGSAVRNWKPGRPGHGALQLRRRPGPVARTTTRCWPPTSASGASRRTSAAWPTWPSSRPTS